MIDSSTPATIKQAPFRVMIADTHASKAARADPGGSPISACTCPAGASELRRAIFAGIVACMPQGMESIDRGAIFGDALGRTHHLLSFLRHRTPRVLPNVDPIGYPLLFNLRDEPRRLSEIAERAYLDMSTVSRQVSALVRQGLVGKVADPSDGRAQLLTLTPEGREVLVEVRARLDRWLAEVVSEWSEADLAKFDSLLRRFAEDVEAHLRR